MIQTILKTGALLYIGLWVKPRWRGFGAAALLVIFVWGIHSEYLGYVHHSGNNRYLAISYLYKWVLTIMALAGYILFIERPLQKKVRSKPGQLSPVVNDGFHLLRNKKTLRSQSQILLEEGQFKDQ